MPRKTISSSTHPGKLDSLAERLRENRVKAIIEPILAGRELPESSNDDRQYLVDLGLLKRDPAGGLVIANPIYREVLPRVLAQGPQDSLPIISPSWLNARGELNTDALLDAFLAFWLQHGEPLLQYSGQFFKRDAIAIKQKSEKSECNLNPK